jgi:hypothetical protein
MIRLCRIITTLPSAPSRSSPSVVHRKVTGGFRSAWGAHAYAALASVIDTAKLRDQSVFDTLVALMGRPVLPYLTAPGS